MTWHHAFFFHYNNQSDSLRMLWLFLPPPLPLCSLLSFHPPFLSPPFLSSHPHFSPLTPTGRGRLLKKLMGSSSIIRCWHRWSTLSALRSYMLWFNRSLSQYLGGQVCPLGVSLVLDSDRLHSGQNHVLGHFHSQSPHACYEDVGCGHPLHGVMTQNIPVQVTETVHVCGPHSSTQVSVCGTYSCLE